MLRFFRKTPREEAARPTLDLNDEAVSKLPIETGPSMQTNKNHPKLAHWLNTGARTADYIYFHQKRGKPDEEFLTYRRFAFTTQLLRAIELYSINEGGPDDSLLALRIYITILASRDCVPDNMLPIVRFELLNLKLPDKEA